MSLLAWERGLKLTLVISGAIVVKSLLAWERGLKYSVKSRLYIWDSVAPCVGAWIEIHLMIGHHQQ